MNRAAALMLKIGIFFACPAHAQGASEVAVKAAFLVKFGAYVDWPGATAGPIALCIVGRDPLGLAMDRAATGQQVNGRSIVIRRLTRIEHDSDCTIAFVAGSPAQDVPAALATIAGLPILSVTDSRFGPARGIVHFQVAQNRVRFHIDDRQAANSGLTISSKLLAIALTVRSRMTK